jgi:flagellin
MSLTIHPNPSVLRAQRHVVRQQEEMQKGFERLSSGSRLPSAGDDPAAYTQARRLRVEARGLAQAARNASEGLAVSQTAESALAEVGDALARMRELAMQSSSGVLSANDRAHLEREMSELRVEIDRIAMGTRFGSLGLLDGTLAPGAAFPIGADTGADVVTLTIPSIRAQDLGAAGTTLNDISISTADGARASLAVIDAAREAVISARSSVGASLNRFERAGSEAVDAADAMLGAASRISDADLARETALLAQGQILSQAGMSVLTQANQLPQMALALLRG